MVVCDEHKELQESITEIKTDIALIKQSLLGNDGRKDGMVDKVNAHDRYFVMIAGGGSLIGLAIAIARVVPNFVK